MFLTPRFPSFPLIHDQHLFKIYFGFSALITKKNFSKISLFCQILDLIQHVSSEAYLEPSTRNLI